MNRPLSRALARLFLLPALAATLLAPRIAQASDGGTDAGGVCIAIDTACTATDTCCMGTCGPFGANDAMICGFKPQVCLAVGASCADDGGTLACGCDTEQCSFGKCATITETQDAGVVVSGCIANGVPCSAGEKCCNAEAYCGSFGGTGNARVCGVDTANSIATSSCSVGGGSGIDAVWIFAGLAIVIGLRRKRLATNTA